MDVEFFVRSVREQIEKATGQALPWGDVNPLVVIGLTEAILDLGLTEDQMYPVIRGFLRQLAAQVHPDRGAANVSGDRQKQILSALDYLDDRQNFSRALDHFRTLKAEDRRESRIARQELSSMRVRLRDFEGQWKDLEAGRHALEGDKQEFRRQVENEKFQVPVLAQQLEELQEELKNAQSVITSYRERSSSSRRQFEHIAEYFAYAGRRDRGDMLAVNAFDAKWVAVASLWPVDALAQSPLEQGKEAFMGKALPIVGSENRVSMILDAWQYAVSSFNEPHGREKKWLPMGLSILKLEGGNPTLVLGHRWAAYGGRVIGSLPPDKINVSRSHLIYQVAKDIVFESMSPFIVAGGVLVSVRSDARRKASWSMTCPAIYFSTKRLVLAVG